MRVPSAVFETADGAHVQVVALHDRHWEALCEALDRREWIDDERCATGTMRGSPTATLVHERDRRR